MPPYRHALHPKLADAAWTDRNGSKHSEIAVDQIRVVSQERLRGKLGQLSGRAGQGELRETIRLTYVD